jgi:bifunctional DNase/RNase
VKATEAAVKCERCEQQATLHVTEARGHAVAAEVHLCESCGRAYLAGVDSPPAPGGPRNLDGECQLELVRLIISELDDHQVLVFREVGGPRSFPLATGVFEAAMLDRRLKRLPCPRPLTHDGWFATLGALGGRLESVGIDAVEDQTYFASLRLARRGNIEPLRVDVRPSDAVAMALIARVPIFISGDLLRVVAE